MRYIFFLALLFHAINIYAQPQNNDCSGVIDLGIAPVCEQTIYTNIDATPFDIDFQNEPGCFTENPPQNDVWFSFTANSEDEDYIITITGIDNNPNPSISNIQAAVYRGDCIVNSLAVFSCGSAANGETELVFAANGLTPNDQYFIRIDNFGGDQNEGTFTVCVETNLKEFDITQGGSTDCSGVLYDSGGPDGDYGNNEDHVFTICPDDFYQCLTFNLEFYNIESTAESFFQGDHIIFYDGPDTSSPEISSVGTDLPANFDAGGGAVCYSVQASGCITIQFTSDDNIAFEGFKGFWECSVEPCTPLDQIEIGTVPTEEEIAQVLSTVNGSVNVKSIQCADGGYALFDNGDHTDLGLNKGIVLTSGSAVNAIGPNFLIDSGSDHYTSGDSDLDALSTILGQNLTSLDACVIEVEVLAFSNTLTFEYVFASEEYPEFVNTEFNDIFALLISGPGIQGEALLNNQANMAVIGPNDTYVQINSVNNFDNYEYYRNNQDGISLEYDGMTSDRFGVKKSLTAVAEVIPCSTYQLKFAIADRTDALYDSGVFISEINIGAPQLSFNFENGLNYLTESCSSGNNFVEISLPQPLTDTLYLNVKGNSFNVDGTAELGVDYELDIPDTLRFLPGETVILLPISAISDQLDEGIETIEISIVNDQCADTEVTRLNGFISDKIEVTINSGEDTISVCRNDSLTLTASGGTNYIWEPAENVSSQTDASVTVDTDTSRWYFVTASIEGNPDPSCIGEDSVFVEVIAPSIEITALDTTGFCQGGTIGVAINTDADPSTLMWNMTAGVDDTTALLTTITPPFGNADGADYIVSVTENGCTVFDTLTLFIEPFDFPDVFLSDTTICEGDTVQLAQSIFGSTTIYQWTPEDSIDNPNISGAIAFPSDTTEFELIAMSPSGNCADTFSLTVNVIPNFVDILPQVDTVLLCLGDSIFLNAVNPVMGENLEWFPNEFFDDSSSSTQTLSPSETIKIYVEHQGESCSDTDSIVIRVDSLPPLAIEAIPAKDKYCPGETVTLISPGYDPDLYPNILHLWRPAPGAQTDLRDLNLAFRTVDTSYYVRQTQNGACISDDSILINTVVPLVVISPSDTLVCPGEPVDISVTSPQQLANVVWDPGDPSLISCMDCLNPTVMSFQTTQYNFSAEADGCPAGGIFTYNVAGNVGIGFDVDPGLTVGLGSQAVITAIISPNPGPNTIYTWTVNGDVIDQMGISITIPILEETNEIRVEFLDQNGCLQSAVVIITGVPPRFVFPNAFTPSTSDDINDVFIPWFSTLEQWEINNFYIYNRWGEKVFDCQDKDCFANGWDGTYKDKDAPGDVYMFVFNYTLPNGDKVTQKGDITLIR